jgi:hypothetical protein
VTSPSAVLRRPDRLYGYVFDLDGTVYLGKALLPGAGEVIASIRERGGRTVFLSNNPTRDPQMYADKLGGLGIATSIDDIVNPVVTVPRWLRTHHPDAGVFVIGEEPVKQALTVAGIRLTEDPEQIDIVVATYHDIDDGRRPAPRRRPHVDPRPDRSPPSARRRKRRRSLSGWTETLNLASLRSRLGDLCRQAVGPVPGLDAPSVARSRFSTSASTPASTRQAVAVEATDPKTPGFSRTTAGALIASPPSASNTARSTSTLPGSCAKLRRRRPSRAATEPGQLVS